MDPGLQIRSQQSCKEEKTIKGLHYLRGQQEKERVYLDPVASHALNWARAIRIQWRLRVGLTSWGKLGIFWSLWY